MEDKQYIEQFENKVKECIKKYKLINKNEKIIIGCSGGKDSMTVLYLLHKWGYNVEGLMIDLLIGKWSDNNLENVKNFCEKNKIKLHIVSIREELGGSMCYIRSVIQAKKKLSNCMICGIIKKWILNKKSRELGAKKIATGHNLDDESETVMMNWFKKSMKISINLSPMVGTTTDKKFIPRIKPLYFHTNEEIKKYSKLMKFPVQYAPCPCAINAYRKDVRIAIKKIEDKHPGVKQNIIKNFLEILPELREHYKNNKETINYCEQCGEPCRKKVCKFCEILEIMK